MSKEFDEFTSVPDINDTTPQKERSFWSKTKKNANKLYEELKQPFLQGTQNLVDVVSPVETNISDLPSVNDALDDAFSVDENDIGFKVYKRIGELAKLKEGFTDPSEDDIADYNENLRTLLVDDMGYDSLGYDVDNKMYVVTKGETTSTLDPTMFQNIVAEVMGDKAEIYGAIAGAKKGVKFGAGIWKVPTALLGGAVGAGLGSVVDTTAGVLSTGQELSAKQWGNEVLKSAVLDAAGAVVGGAVIKVAGKTLSLPKDTWNLLKNGNIDGAKKVLQSDLKLSDADSTEALKQMVESTQETYGEGIFKGLEAKQEKLLASVMSSPQGGRIVKEALSSNPKAAFELERSIDLRAKSILDSTHEVSGTAIKTAVEGYEKRVGKQYADMRRDIKEAFKESPYRFDLDTLKLDDTLDDLGKRVTDPFVKAKFDTMLGAVKNVVEGSKNGIGIEKDVDALLDIRQMMNKFYRKNEKAFELAPDKKSFKEMIGSIDKEVDSAMDTLGNDELKKALTNSFDSARVAYKEMYDTKGSSLYKTLMSEGKNADERVSALLKHAKDDAGEFVSLLSKLEPKEVVQIEDSIISAVLNKNKRGKGNELKSLDYASVVEEFKTLKPFIKSKHTLKSIQLTEDMYKKYQHDFELSKVVKNVTEDTPSGGIATTAEGRMKAAGAKRIFEYAQTMIPWGDGAKRLALQRHIGKALERSRTPVQMARELAFDEAIPNETRKHLKKLISANNELLKAKTKETQETALAELNTIAKEIEQEQLDHAKSIADFKTPSIEEIRTVEKLFADDKGSTLGRSIRAIQEGKANKVDVERYLNAKNSIADEKFSKTFAKEQLLRLPAKYKDVGEEQVKELETLRDYMMSHEGTSFGATVHPKQFQSLLYDLKNTGYPRSMKYDEIYQDLRGVYDELKDDISRAYGSSANEPMDNYGNPLFGIGATVGAMGAVSQTAEADASLDAMVGIDSDFWDESVVIEKFKEIDREIYRVNRSYQTTPKEKRESIKALEEQKEILTQYLPLEKKDNDYVSNKKKNIKNIIAHIESRGDYNAKNPNSSARGKYQFINSTLNYVSKKTGLDKKYLKTPIGQEQAMDFLMKENQRVLERKGVPIGAFTLYGAHQLGASGFARVYKGNPSKKDISNMKNNLPKNLKNTADITGSWIKYYKEKVAHA